MRTTRLSLTAILFLLAAWPAAASAAPTCAEGPETVGETIVGTPCADTVLAPPGVETVDAGAGDDVIVPAAIAAAVPFPGEHWLGVGSQTFEGGAGDDLVFGERGNDTLRGGAGNDRLYGGIGDDLLRGGPGQDQLAGGHGFDSIDGDAGDDYVRGDGTIDRIFDTGGGIDTLSYALGVTPGFGGNMSAFPGFPPPGGERGVRLDLGAGGQNGNNGTASFGGGVDEVEGQSFERVIGTAFSDYILGSGDAEAIYGGGGADAIAGNGGGDTLAGGADGDHLDAGDGTGSLDGGPGEDHCAGGGATTGCEPKGAGVAVRDTSQISVGFGIAAGALPRSQLYLVGSSEADSVTASYAPGPPEKVTFEASADSAGSFGTSLSAYAGCDPPAGSDPEQVACSLASPLEALVVAGMAGADELQATNFPSTVSVMLLGGGGDDDVLGGDRSEDVLVDGDASGADEDDLVALGRDDALLHNAGSDTRLGGDGNDLFLSTSICDGDDLKGGAGRDNGSWARLPEAVHANLELGLAGRPGSGATPACGAEQLDALGEIEDLEGTSSEPTDPGDNLYGDSGPNQLLGWSGPDRFFAAAGDDTILANSADTDLAIDCGGGNDKALIDIPQPSYADPAPVACELVEEAAENSFRFKTQLPPPLPPSPEEAAQPSPRPDPRKSRGDSRAPRTRIVSHPPALVATAQRRRRVAFAFAASETGARFRCRLDRRRFLSCRSPRAYHLAPGPHAFRVYAIDAAGNRDRSPAVFAFRIRRR